MVLRLKGQAGRHAASGGIPGFAGAWWTIPGYGRRHPRLGIHCRQAAQPEAEACGQGKEEKGYYHDFTYGKTEQRTTHNIIAVLPGKDKKLKHEYIVVGSHYDHLGMGGKAPVRAVPTHWAFTPVPTTMPAAMPWCSSWPGISRRCARHEASSSPSSALRNRDS